MTSVNLTCLQAVSKAVPKLEYGIHAPAFRRPQVMNTRGPGMRVPSNFKSICYRQLMLQADVRGREGEDLCERDQIDLLNLSHCDESFFLRAFAPDLLVDLV